MHIQASPIFELNLGDKFDTSKVVGMDNMFYFTGASNQKFKLDCSGWNVDKVTNCIDFNKSVTSKVTPPAWKINNI